MAHQPMHINDWIEIDKDLKWYIEQKTRVIQEQGALRVNFTYIVLISLILLGKHVIDSLPENDAGCGELLEILVDYLPKRYPKLFEKIDCKGGGIWNKVTNEKFTSIEGRTGVDALTIVSRSVFRLKRCCAALKTIINIGLLKMIF